MATRRGLNEDGYLLLRAKCLPGFIDIQVLDSAAQAMSLLPAYLV